MPITPSLRGANALRSARGMILAGRHIVIADYVNGWTFAAVAGGTQQSALNQMYIETSATANSSELQRILCPHLSAPDGANQHDWDMRKRWLIGFNLAIANADAQASAALQFKAATTIGDLGAVGLGVQCANLALSGESYGSARGSVSIATLTAGKSYHVGIELFPGLKVDYYLDGVLTATQSTAANVPNALFAANGNIFAKVANGAAGGADYTLSMNGLEFWLAS